MDRGAVMTGLPAQLAQLRKYLDDAEALARTDYGLQDADELDQRMLRILTGLPRWPRKSEGSTPMANIIPPITLFERQRRVARLEFQVQEAETALVNARIQEDDAHRRHHLDFRNKDLESVFLTRLQDLAEREVNLSTLRRQLGQARHQLRRMEKAGRE